MKKLCWLSSNILLFVILVLPCKGQNLVYNGDISIVDSCDFINSINVAPNFFNPTSATPDVFNSCSTNPPLSVPNNFITTKYPFAGSGYFGITYSSFYYEYISAKLTKSLRSGYIYCVSFRLARASENYNCFDQMGILFTIDKPFYAQVDRIVSDSFLTTPKGQVLCESEGWQRINYEYTASGSEKYLTIGQFLPYEELTFDPPFPAQVFYLVDSIIVIECAAPEKPIIKLHNVFTPNNDGINDTYDIEISGANQVQVQIFNRWGNLVFESTQLNPVWDGNYNGNPVAEGVYFVVVHAEGVNQLKTIEKQTVHLVR